MHVTMKGGIIVGLTRRNRFHASSAVAVIGLMALVVALVGDAGAKPDNQKSDKDEAGVTTVTGSAQLPGPFPDPGEVIPLTNGGTFTQGAGEAVLVTADAEMVSAAFGACDVSVTVTDANDPAHVGLEMSFLLDRGDPGDHNDSGALPAPEADVARDLDATINVWPLEEFGPHGPCDSDGKGDVSVRISVVKFRN